jgi:hypothetical protein
MRRSPSPGTWTLTTRSRWSGAISRRLRRAASQGRATRGTGAAW